MQQSETQGSRTPQILYLEAFVKARWPAGARCIRCGSDRIHRFERLSPSGEIRWLYQCNNCRYQFSPTAGSIFHGTHLSLQSWLQAIALVCGSSKHKTVAQLALDLGVTYKTAWLVLRRIRKAMREDPSFCTQYAAVALALHGETEAAQAWSTENNGNVH